MLSRDLYSIFFGFWVWLGSRVETQSELDKIFYPFLENGLGFRLGFNPGTLPNSKPGKNRVQASDAYYHKSKIKLPFNYLFI